MEYQGVSIFPNIFVVASLCSFICLQAVYQLSGAVCKATWNGYPSYSLLTFISRFYQNAANCMTIRFRYIAQSRGYGKPTAHVRPHNDFRRLTSRSNGIAE